MIVTKIQIVLKDAGIATLLLSILIYTSYLMLEPKISGAVSTSEQFTVSLTVSEEISFFTPPSDVSLSPALSGLTGGTANGGTQVRVLTNNATGYQMSLKASSSLGMIGHSNGGVIPALVPSVGTVPNFSFDSGTVAANTTRFAYSVEASTTADLDPSFKDNGSACNTGSSDTANKCWLNASTTPEVVINRTTITPNSGATTTIKFRVVMRSNPSPLIPNDTYTATTTLTATTN